MPDRLLRSLGSLALALALGAAILGALAWAAHRFEAEQRRRREGIAPRQGGLARWFLRLLHLLSVPHLPGPLEAVRQRRRARLRAVPLPERWRAILTANVPLYTRLPPERRRELEGHVQVLLAEKRFEGCAGLELTDEVRVTVAAHAALLLLGRGEEAQYYPDLVSILVYPSAYLAPVEERRGGIVTERQDGRLGESWRRGVVVLAWDAARAGARDARDGDNVILHEFAHQLDTEDGVFDGVPSLDRPSDYAAWARELASEYERLRERPHKSVLDAYGATDPAEFFAVATEAFFEKPHQLHRRHPALYAELSRFYRMDPAAGGAEPLAATGDDDRATPVVG
jgi:MtfA peptidase